jgi:hypothetical protein
VVPGVAAAGHAPDTDPGASGGASIGMKAVLGELNAR